MRFLSTVAGLALACAWTCGVAAAQTPTQGQRVQVQGELVDTWCYVSGIMFAEGTAHHQCAVWCAIGGIPVSIRDAKGNVYLLIRLEDDEANVANPRIATILSHDVSVDAELVERDGVKYLFVSRIADDKGIVNMTHAEYGVIPFGE